MRMQKMAWNQEVCPFKILTSAQPLCCRLHLLADPVHLSFERRLLSPQRLQLDAKTLFGQALGVGRGRKLVGTSMVKLDLQLKDLLLEIGDLALQTPKGKTLLIKKIS